MAVVISAAVVAFGTEAFAGAVLTAITDIGLATSVVGAITGSKDLMKIGGVLGLAGGIGSLANAAFGSVGDAALSTASDLSGNVADSAATTAAPIVDTGIQDALNGAQPYSVTPGGGDLPGSNLNNSSMPAPGSSPMTSGSMPSTQPSLAPTPAAQVGAGGTQYGAGGGQPSLTQAPGMVSSGQSGLSTDPTGMGGQSGNGMSFNDKVYDASDYKLNDASNAYDNNPASGGWMDKLASTWKSLSPQAQAELVKAGMAIPGGIQSSKNKQIELAQNQQKINNSYISSIPRAGIINSAKGS